MQVQVELLMNYIDPTPFHYRTEQIMNQVLVSGKLLATIPPSGANYSIRWPLYPTFNDKQQLLISDCHNQNVLVFNNENEYVKTFPLKTFGGNFVLKPHGIACNGNDLFVIDRGIDTMEVFLGKLLSSVGMKIVYHFEAVLTVATKLSNLVSCINVVKEKCGRSGSDVESTSARHQLDKSFQSPSAIGFS